MVVSEHRLKRMIRIVDMMRKQQYPNYTKIRRAFEQATFDTTETMVLTCDRKTIWQDLKISAGQEVCALGRLESFIFHLKEIELHFLSLSFITMKSDCIGRRTAIPGWQPA